MEVGENLVEHRHRASELAVAEEDPAQAGKVEGTDDAQHLHPAMAVRYSRLLAREAHPHLVEHQCHTVQRTPCHEVPRRTVP